MEEIIAFLLIPSCENMTLRDEIKERHLFFIFFTPLQERR